MPIRKATLEEWFLILQLKKVRTSHFHLPFSLDVDVTAIQRVLSAGGKGDRIPWTSIVIKASGIALEKNTGLNRIVFPTFYGLRMLEPKEIAVNVPVMIEDQGKRFLIAAAVKNAHQKPLAEIREELRSASQKKVKDLIIGKYVYGLPNHFLNRARLRLIHFLVNHFPGFYEKFGGGGISVTSLLNVHDGESRLRIQGFGQTAFTLGLASVTENAGVWTMRLGIAYDHFAFSGEDGARFSNSIAEILSGKDTATLARLTQ